MMNSTSVALRILASLARDDEAEGSRPVTESEMLESLDATGYDLFESIVRLARES